MLEFLPRLLAHLASAERQRGGFLLVPHDLPTAMDAVGQDGEHKWLNFMKWLDEEGYFAHTRPPTTAKRVLTTKAHELASRA